MRKAKCPIREGILRNRKGHNMAEKQRGTTQPHPNQKRRNYIKEGKIQSDHWTSLWEAFKIE